jgi:hypothetical protein
MNYFHLHPAAENGVVPAEQKEIVASQSKSAQYCLSDPGALVQKLPSHGGGKTTTTMD